MNPIRWTTRSGDRELFSKQRLVTRVARECWTNSNARQGSEGQAGLAELVDLPLDLGEGPAELVGVLLDLGEGQAGLAELVELTVQAACGRLHPV